jgi:membrane-bound serine protease (ClpP class)
LLAFGLFVGEVLTSTFGIFTAGGITALTIGSLILYKGGPLFQINPWLIAIVAIFMGGLFAFVVNRVISSHRHRATTGKEEILGNTAVVKVALEPEGMVLLKGERWKAISESGRVEPEEEVLITKVDGLKLWVTKKQ